MATVTPRPFDRSETQRKIRHPLYALSGYIRRYVILEGLAVAILFVAAAFWAGLLFDFGLFIVPTFPSGQSLGLDWVKWLDRSYPAETAFFVRAFILALFLIGLLAVVAFKVFRRLFTEFSDSSLALVLEKRFPKQLGDRLITAVELADPGLADKYGYSQEMVDNTIKAAADRVAKVPVKEVFNWGRLTKLWVLAILCSVGIYLLLAIGSMGYLSAVSESPGEFFWRFNRTASIWTKRNVMLMDKVYWPTQSFVEFVRFQVSETKNGTDIMKVARDEKRPDIEVRAYQWVIYDAKAPDSIRPLKLKDLDNWVDKSLLEINLPSAWGGWFMDFDDLDATIPNTTVQNIMAASADPAAKNKETDAPRTSAQLRKALENPTLRKTLVDAGVLEKVEAWLDWKNWTIDQIQVQMEKPEVKKALVEQYSAVEKQFDNLIGQLEELSSSPWTNWDIRKMKMPPQVQATYVGQQTRSSRSSQRQGENRYFVSLVDLKESVTLTVQAEDFYTIPKEILLVPPPQFTRLEIFLDEPAYKHYRLQTNQDFLKGKKHRIQKTLLLTGPTNQFEVLSGTNIKMVATAERELKKGSIALVKPEKSKVKDSEIPRISPQLLADGKTIVLEIPGSEKTYEFDLIYTDQDNVKGNRPILIRAVPDAPPEEIAKFQLGVQLRQPSTGEESTGQKSQNVLKGYLITLDALVPFKGSMKDDFGLTKMEWVYDYQPMQFSLFRGGSEGGVDPQAEVKKQLDLVRRTRLLMNGFNTLPIYPPHGFMAPLQLGFLTGSLIERDIQLSSGEPGESIVKGEPSAMLKFKAELEKLDSSQGMSVGSFQDLLNTGKLVGDPPPAVLFKDYSLEKELGFDIRSVLKKTLGPKTSDEIQKHYRLRVWMSGTDNNLETGPKTTLSKEPIIFLVVSPAELRALILIEEDAIRAKLEKTRDGLEKDGRLIVNDQMDKLKANASQDLTLIRLRVEEVRKKLEDTRKVVTQALADYERIYDELVVNFPEDENPENRSLQDRVLKKILIPMQDITRAGGELALAQEAANKAYGQLEDDENTFKSVQGKAIDLPLEVRNKHVSNLTKAGEEMDGLVKKLNGIINAIGGEFDRTKAEALLKAIIEDSERQNQELRAYEDRVLKDLLKKLGGGAGIP